MKNLLALAILLPLTSFALASEVPVLSCMGTEPFWDISTDANGSLAFDSPQTEENKLYPQTTLKNAAGTGEDFAFQVDARDEAGSSLKLNVVKTECNNGMSDTIYSYTALVDVDGVLLFGCCN
jgi:uncharacterized membrane protein